MKTKADFQQAALSAISEYPTAAQAYQARDPRFLAKLDAMATMLALLSAEQDVAAMEPWTKARDVTVLADAAAKGILPFGRATRVKIAVTNPSASPLAINVGRRLLDTQGRLYVVDLGATIPAAGSGYVHAVQRSEVSFEHKTGLSAPFYQIEVPQPDAGKHIENVRLLDSSTTTEYAYTADFVNVEAGAHVFHLMTDENRRVLITLGAAELIGVQPASGSTFNVIVNQTEGAIELSAGSLFSFEYSASLYENGAVLTLDSVLSPGANPMDIATMREVISYPSVYDSSAVYLGNFDFLVRRNLSPFTFLSVWNEKREEEARGPSVDNINTIFVSALKAGVVQADLEDQIEAIILRADDSYKVSFVAANEVEIAVSITASVATIYDTASVTQQIKELFLANYGIDSPFAKRGQTRILKKDVFKLLRDNVQALQDRVSDLDVTITDPPGSMMPEDFRYVSNLSLTVTVGVV